MPVYPVVPEPRGWKGRMLRNGTEVVFVPLTSKATTEHSQSYLLSMLAYRVPLVFIVRIKRRSEMQGEICQLRLYVYSGLGCKVGGRLLRYEKPRVGIEDQF